jgi:pimeloyl-ACP methyl ester carboxylesterase
MVRAMDAARREDPRAVLRELQCPVLVVRGRHDRICPADWAEALARAAPAGSRSVTLGRGAHMVPLTHGGLLAAAVCAALG